MHLIQRPFFRRIALWSAVFAALLFFFRYAAPTPAAASFDEGTSILLLRDGTPEETTLAYYLPRAVAAEMPVSFGPEALKAQAVAARSYVLSGPRHENAQVCTDSGCCIAWRDDDALRELWGEDFEKNLAAVTAAVAATDGQVLTYGGEIIQAVFHASSAARTEDSAAVWSARPYLLSVDTPETPETVADLVTVSRFSPEELAARLGLDADAPPETWLRGTEPDGAGRTAILRIADQALTGTFVRSALGLRSTAFTVEYDGEAFVFTAAGSGHGVGMSQTGAKLLGEAGLTYGEILAHYYPGTELTAR